MREAFIPFSFTDGPMSATLQSSKWRYFSEIIAEEDVTGVPTVQSYESASLKHVIVSGEKERTLVSAMKHMLPVSLCSG